MRPSAYVQRGFTKGEYARDARSRPVEVDDPRAVRWCMVGAIDASVRDLTITPAQGLAIEIVVSRLVGGTSSWSDRQTTAKPVIAVLLEAEAAVLDQGEEVLE